MSRKLYFNVENLKAIKESMASDKHICHTHYCDNVNEAAPEVDEYEIGAESDEPPIGGNYYHINEGYYHNALSSIDLCDVGEVKYEWYFDEDEYLEWLQDNELTDSEESRNQYYTEEVQYGVEYYDSETLHYMESDQNLSFDELVELFGEDMANKMLSNCIQNGEGSFEPYELYENETYDLTNPQEVNDIAMKLFPHGGYYRDCRGFILTNGVIVYTPSEHNEIQMIPGVKSKFDFIEMGNIRIMPNSIDIGAEPTYEQEQVLRELIASYSDDEFYLDIFANGGEIGTKYIHPNWRYVIGEIDRFYSEGIKPQGSDFYEMKNKNENMLFESQESKSIAAAKKLVMQKFNYNEQQADEFIRIKLRNDIPILRTPQGGKFILGVTRMFCGNELMTANDIGNLNSTLKLVASDAHINEYDRNLNGLSCRELIQRFSKAISDNLEAEKSEISSMVFDTPSDYEIVKINSFEHAEQYGQYVSWCVTHDENMFNSYTSDGINQFYFCLKRGFENVEEKPTEGCPLDEYGLSMIAVSVNENGMLNTCTCRWNHDNNGNDSVMNAKQVSQVIGMNFFEVFKPNNKWEEVLSNALERIANGEDIKDIFDYCGDFNEGFASVEMNGKWNFIDTEGKFLSEQWFDYCNDFNEGFASVEMNDKWNFVGRDGKLLSGQWFDYCGDFNEGFAKVELKSKWNFIGRDGKLLSGQWFDDCSKFNKGFARVLLNGEWFFIGRDGKLTLRYGKLALKESKSSNKKIMVSSGQIAMLKENIDLEVSSSDIDLSSFKKKDELVPSLWGEDGKLDSRIRLKLLDIADDFWKFVNLTWVEPRGIILTGSICNFNWSKYSDIDLHLIVDFNEIDEKTEFVKAYLDSKKNEWNDEHSDLKIMGHQVELYTQNIDEMPQSSGIYDLEENDWIREPNPNDIKAIGLNKFSIKDKAAKIMTIIDDMCDSLELTDDSYEIRKIGDDANYLWKKIKNMRKISLDKNGESGNGNIVYKYMRRQGYLDKLSNLRALCYDKENSINESKEIIKEYLEKDNNLPLYKYFKWASTASSCEKARDLAYSCSYYIDKYIEKIIHKYTKFEDLLDENNIFDYEDESLIEAFLELLKRNNLCDHFISEMSVIVSDYYEQPTWMNTSFNRIVKNEWCIHFTKDADNIAKYGLTGGTNDIGHLAYTNAGQEKSYEGYNFAFLIDDRSVDCNKYGDEAVIFRTSGVEIYHYGDDQNQVIFWGPNVKSFIPIHQENGDWVVYGQNGQILVRKEYPSEIAIWATENLPQYRKQIMTGKNGYIPKMSRWNGETNKVERVPYPLYKNESIRRYITLLKEQTINEETVADGSSNGNPYKERWKAEREALKNYVCNYGTVMQSKEDNKGGKLYKVLYDKWISELIGYNYALCVQWDAIKLKPKSIVYVRALDKFTPNIRTNIEYDTRGFDNVQGTYDDVENY